MVFPLPRWYGTLRRVGVVALGNAVSAGLGLAVIVILARFLSPVEFGLAATMIALVDGGQLLIDASLNAGIVHVTTLRKSSPTVLRTGFWLKILCALAIALAFALGADWLSHFLVGDDGIAASVRWAAVALVASSVTSFCLTTLQAEERFATLAMLTPLKNVLRLVGISLAALLGGLSVEIVVIAIAAGALATAAVAFFLLSSALLKGWEVSTGDLRAMLKVSVWMVMVAVSNVGSRLDIWLIATIGNAKEAGLYAAALQLCMVVGIVSQSLVTTMLPRMSRMQTKAEMTLHVKHSLLILPPLVFVFGCVWMVAEPVLGLLLGAPFEDATPVFLILFASSLMTLAVNPILLVLFPLGETRIFGLTSLAQLVLRVGMAVPLISLLGAEGAAIAELTAKIVSTAVLALFVVRLVNRSEDATH
jgi:PST family polysaccharide transporter